MRMCLKRSVAKTGSTVSNVTSSVKSDLTQSPISKVILELPFSIFIGGRFHPYNGCFGAWVPDQNRRVKHRGCRSRVPNHT